MKIMIAPSYEAAAGAKPDATVEAEYGGCVVEGRLYTLAHHSGKYKSCPAPCEFPNQHGFSGDTLISHIDLDTVGGCLALYGVKPADEDFWKAAGFIDVKGPHHANELPAGLRVKLQAYWAYSDSLGREKYVSLSDVTEKIMEQGEAIGKIIGGDPCLLQRGELWARASEDRVEANLVGENECARFFITSDVFCNASYYSPKQRRIIPAVVSWNKKYGSVTISFADGGKEHSAANMARELWGDLAGGHRGIAGSPRCWGLPEPQMEIEFRRAIEAVSSLHANARPNASGSSEWL
ncbi:MAG: hypothetical protein LBU32_21975 [Clostridiales bacterium]|nr:hypothetical protein [Clostridiales bacterium]